MKRGIDGRAGVLLTAFLALASSAFLRQNVPVF